MRSIRRSMTVYLFALLAVTLGVAWVVIDQMMARALAAREGAGADLIHAEYDKQCREERARIDEALFNQAKLLGNIMQLEYYNRLGAEMVRYNVANTFAPLMFLSPTDPTDGVLLWSAWTGAVNQRTFGRPNHGQATLSRLYFANLPIPDDLLEHLDEKNPEDRAVPEYFQINTLAGREWRSRSLGTRHLPFASKEIDAKPADPANPVEGPNVIDWKIGPAVLGPENEPVLRVLYKMPHFTSGPGFGGPPRGRGGPDRKDDRPPGPGGPGSGNRSLVGAYASWVTAFGTPPPWSAPSQPPPTPSPDSMPRLYIQCARPQAAIDATLAKFAAERDEKLGRLMAEIRKARGTLRLQVAGIGVLAFLAVAFGGPLLVGRGLRPVGKLSDAVSRVSERDFKLPHDGTDLSVELAPIHARLTQTLDLLQRAFSREKQAVADISHELRTPIAALLATIDVTLRKPRSPEQYRATLEECRLISKQLSQLVERIMMLASLDAGNDRTLVARTDAAELVAGCAAVIRPLAAAHNVTVELRADEPLELDTDPGKLREVLMNLLHNAVEYNRPGGAIEFAARRAEGAVVFEVRDSGIGVSADIQDKIFERFYRADSSRHATGVHAGLGLAIVKEYVARLNGTIVVESEPGVGSTFRVTLPAPLAGPEEFPAPREAVRVGA